MRASLVNVPSHSGFAKPEAGETVADRPSYARNAWLRDEVMSLEAPLRKYLRRCGLRPCEVEDICQDAYVRLLESLEHSTPRCTKAFLFRIVRNLTFDLRRSARHRWLALTGNLEDLDCATVLDPERYAIAFEDLENLLAVVNALPARRREVVLLRRVEGVSLKTIAEAMRIGVPAVEKHLTLALRTLRKLESPANR